MKYPAYLLSLLLLSSWVFAQSETTPAGPESTAAATTSSKPALPNITGSTSTGTPKKTTAKTRPAPRFSPTEKIRADQAVAFPVDI